jgi:hypothetical protein
MATAWAAVRQSTPSRSDSSTTRANAARCWRWRRLAISSSSQASFLLVLDPLEVRHGHAAGVGEHVGDDRDPLRARRSSAPEVIGPLAALTTQAAVDADDVVAGDLVLQRRRHQHVTGRLQHLGAADRLVDQKAAEEAVLGDPVEDRLDVEAIRIGHPARHVGYPDDRRAPAASSRTTTEPTFAESLDHDALAGKVPVQVLERRLQAEHDPRLVACGRPWVPPSTIGFPVMISGTGWPTCGEYVSMSHVISRSPADGEVDVSARRGSSSRARSSGSSASRSAARSNSVFAVDQRSERYSPPGATSPASAARTSSHPPVLRRSLTAVTAPENESPPMGRAYPRLSGARLGGPALVHA